ncbi:hypothetical protein FZEAL_2809 [Fusarium zealandicum]|uniref:RCC1-like domain-containing protein n=1 Tax=Fusarium zealandicum TaxID=1053134 RepID=A0A8H4UQT0_9HYPO|nr:hypothetical protein FZEAL_2809 [Fusarium zealandicum]
MRLKKTSTRRKTAVAQAKTKTSQSTPARISSRNTSNPAKNSLPKDTASSAKSTSTKRKTPSHDLAQPPSKRTKAVSEPRATAASEKTTTAPRPLSPGPALNQPPSQPLSVFVVGSGECGELGLGPNETETQRPRINPFLNPKGPSSKYKVFQLSCGGMNTVARTVDNKIVTWGVNVNYALGRNTDWDGVLRDVDADSSNEEEEGELNPHEFTPTAIPGSAFPLDTRFVHVAAGDSCSFALTDTGLVYGWGTFRDGSGNEQFGYDTDGRFVKGQKKPVLIPGIQNITQITCGANHVLALEANGRVWGWGSDEQNQLGHRLLDVMPNTSDPVSLKDNVWAGGLNSFGEAGYAKGAGSDSALLPYPIKIPGLGSENVVVIDGGAHHSAAVTATGECLVWGRIDGGKLGVEFTSSQLDDEQVIRYDERDKPRNCLQPTLARGTGRAVHVACGTGHTVFVNEAGKGFAAGLGSSGQLGLGSDDDVEVARQVQSKDLEGRVLTWAGAGGQFSIVAGPTA